MRLASAVRVTAAIGAMVAACQGAPPPSSASPAEPTVAARWTADDGSVVAINVVMPVGFDPEGLLTLARRYRDEHPAARVIVTFFSPAAGPERFVIGHVPTDGGPVVTSEPPATVLAVFDLPTAGGP